MKKILLKLISVALRYCAEDMQVESKPKHKYIKNVIHTVRFHKIISNVDTGENEFYLDEYLIIKTKNLNRILVDGDTDRRISTIETGECDPLLSTRISYCLDKNGNQSLVHSSVPPLYFIKYKIL